MRNALAPIALEPVSGLLNGFAFGGALLFVVGGRRAQCGGHRIDDRFEKTNQSG